VEEVNFIFIYIDPSSLAPKKQLSLPKPPKSNIFKTETYFHFLFKKISSRANSF